jgi:hypothetical protein
MGAARDRHRRTAMNPLLDIDKSVADNFDHRPFGARS